MEDKLRNQIKDTIQDGNISFLAGSGLSYPYLSILGNIENLLTELAKATMAEREKKIIEVSIYKKFFDEVISKNIEILEDDAGSKAVLGTYKKFLQSINSILLNRKSTILCKQVNIFTTNVDIFHEKALEELELEYNDGFSGRFSPVFNLGNFNKTSFRKSLHYDNISEIPVFNLLKVHGSLSWMKGATEDEIIFARDLELLKQIKAIVIPEDTLVNIEENSTIASLLIEAEAVTGYSDVTLKSFTDLYEKLQIINPTKEKFEHTVFGQTFYDLLRIYSNELEKENSVLFVLGFSFADEHIRKLTIRAVNSNPTLKVYIFAHKTSDVSGYIEKLDISNLKNKNIEIISPTTTKDEETGIEKEDYEYNLENFNSHVLVEILRKIEDPESDKK